VTPDPRIHPRSLASVSPTVPLTPLLAQPRPSRWATPAALAGWFAMNLAMLAPDFQGAVLAGGRPATPGMAVLLALPSSLLLTAAGWAAFRLARRHTVGPGTLLRGLAVHAAAALGFAAANVAVRRAVRATLAEYDPVFAPGQDAGELVAVVVVYAVLVVVAHALLYARRYRERRLAELRLQASLARAGLERASAELRVLKLQLNPHFLFNSLHAVSALVHTAPATAERMVGRLAELLRHAVDRVGTQEVPLDDEVRTLEPFLEVEALRMAGRLRVEWAIEPDAGGAWVPHMVLQPLVENAIKHGLASRERGGCVQVAARRDGEWLELAVRDDGVGLAAAAGRNAAGGGIGTANTRARLARLYGDRHALDIAPAEGGGTRVAIRIPWHQSPWPARALDAPAAETAPSTGGIPWPGRMVAAAFFLLLWRNGFAGMYGRHIPGRTVGVAEATVCGGLSAAMLTLLFAAAFVMARRAPVVAGSAARAVARHARTAVIVAALVTLERNACTVLWGTPANILVTPRWLTAMLVEAGVWTAIFGAASVLAHALEYARRARMTEAAALRLQASLARAELERTSTELRGLRMQVNPGFLFTALSAVASRVHQAPDDAERMLVRLADLLRQAMRGAGAGEVPLEDELRALEPFLEVERLRLGGRLHIRQSVDDEALDALVPAMVLQPLLVHACGRDAAEGDASLSISARRRGEWLEVEVCDAAPPDASEGDGAAEARDRLARLYGNRCAVEVGPAAGGGTRALLRLPWHDEPWPAAVPAAREETMAR
jgi:two-component system LytT family sensor kinase